MTRTLSESHLPGLTRIRQGKVRDVYSLPNQCLLLVATDRLSAFDVILPDPIPGKGEILTQMSNFWFARTAAICANHLTGIAPASVLPAGTELALYERRSVVAQHLRALPVEAIARGYLIGSGWKEYTERGSVSGIKLPAGLQLAAELPQPLFTPSSKAPAGAHDENIDFDEVVRLIGADLAEQIRAATLALYAHARRYALGRGIIIADTKFEFGVDELGQLRVMDEVLTPDSSRFWEASDWRPGRNPRSFDKQFVRDYLETLDWNKRAPGPRLPAAIIEGTRARYAEALSLLTA